MTPQLQQAIKLLQLSSVELSAYIEEELLQNPMLERAEPAGEDGDGDRANADAPAAESLNGAESHDADDYDAGLGDDMAAPDSVEFTANGTMPEEGSAPLDIDADSVWSEDGPSESLQATEERFETPSPLAYDGVAGGSGGRLDFTERDGDLEATLRDEPSLREHLTEQLTVDIADSVDRLIGLHLIESLDDSGWLSEPTEQTAERLGCDHQRVCDVLACLQRFDPPGIFARDLRECLALQLQDRNRLDPAMQAMLDNLDLVAKHDKSALLKLCGVDAEDLRDMVAEIRTLDPKPALAFQHEVAMTVTPDILMRPHPKGGWSVELNPETLPRVLVNVDYYTQVRGEVRDKQEREYINECFQSANWLVKSLHQRATTILKVASEIIRQQDAFFRKGIAHMRPLVLRDIAEAIEMHESTVSRVTNNKFMHTPRGMFELKYFFSAAIANTGGGSAHSAEAVRFRIKSLIDDESPADIFSDDRIVEILNKDGIDIARRTVAKYREAMKIPSSVQRRREKNKSL